MLTALTRRQRAGADLVVSGSVLGVLAGFVQAIVGSDIPAWTGAKASPGALGLLTVALCVAAGAGTVALYRPDTGAGGRLGASCMAIVVGLLCFSTVGRLWFIPGPLLLVGAVLSVERWKSAWAMIAQHWLRVLLGALGACELLMAAGATALTMAFGVIGGCSLVGAATVAGRNRRLTATLMAVGTLPFAVFAWTAIVPIPLLLLVAVLATPILRTPKKPAASTPALPHG